MKKLSYSAIGAIVVLVISLVALTDVTAIFSRPSAESLAAKKLQRENGIYTEMCAGGHAFGFSGDITEWDGWYLDTTKVGDDLILKYDSVGPSSLRLTLAAREIVADLSDSNVERRIREFMSPLKGFKRFRKNYEVTLDSVVDKEYGVIKCMGLYSFVADYADSCVKNAPLINSYICKLTGVSSPQISQLSELSDSLANKTFEDWRRYDETDESSNGARLEIRAVVANSKFVTVSIYDYERIGTGHGGYFASFRTLDLESGEELSNEDIFMPGSLDKVKSLLFKTMASDSFYREWYPDLKSEDDVMDAVMAWNSRGIEHTDAERKKYVRNFELPEVGFGENGLIFSFQPYEINCWAAGALHFIVPYQKLLPYLTPKAKSLAKHCTN